MALAGRTEGGPWVHCSRDQRPRAFGARACGGRSFGGKFYLSQILWKVQLLETRDLGTLQAGSRTPQTSSPFPREARLTGAAACNGRGDPPASRWPGKERVSRTGARGPPPPPMALLTPATRSLLPCPYQHEVLVPLQLLHSPGQPLPFLLPGLILQAPELLIALLLPSGFVLDLAQGNH